MIKKQWMRILVAAIILIIPITMLSGCKNEEKKASQAYYVISEELDIKRTTDKAKEILDNVESQTEDNSGKEN